MMVSRLRQRNTYIIVLFFLVIAFVYTLPIYYRLTNWGILDWDQHLFYHAVPRATLLEHRQIPLWNPYYCGGTVLLANPQSRLLSPSFVLILLFGEVIGVKIEIWLYLVIGLLGTYELARHYGLDELSALMASSVFMLNSMYALNLTVGMTWFLSVAFLPWALLFYLKALSELRYALVSGLFLALMFFSGGAYPLAVTVSFFALYSFLLVAFKVHEVLKVAKSLSIILIFALCFGAIKFFPAIEFMYEHPRRIYDYSGFSLNSLRFSLFSRDQSLAAIAKLPIEQGGFINGVVGAMDENGMYIGITPFILFLLGIGLHDRHRMFLLLCLIVFLWISFGNRPPAELWSLLHFLPVYGSMRVAQRFRIIFMLCLSIFVGFGFRTARYHIARVIAHKTLARAIPLVVLLGVVVDLLMVNPRVFREAFQIPPLETTRSDRFYQVWDIPAYDKNGWKDSFFGSSLYPAFLSNIGIIDCYETADVPRNATPASSDDYKGEVFLYGTEGSVFFNDWSPNKVIISVSASSPGFVMLNQNYYSGWRVVGDRGRNVEEMDGLLAVRVSPQDTKIELQYLPTSFVVGLIVTSVTILLSLIFVVIYNVQGRSSMATKVGQDQFPGG